MQFKGSKTEEKIKEAFARELRAQAYYKYFAEIAANAGEEQIADMFSETAKNEAEHARHEFDFLNGHIVGSRTLCCADDQIDDDGSNNDPANDEFGLFTGKTLGFTILRLFFFYALCINHLALHFGSLAW